MIQINYSNKNVETARQAVKKSSEQMFIVYYEGCLCWYAAPGINASVFQTLLMEIPLVPSRSGFGCVTTRPQVPPLLPGRTGMASNCWPFCVASPLRMERSHWCPLCGQNTFFSTMSQGALAACLCHILLLLWLFWLDLWSVMSLTDFCFSINSFIHLHFLFFFFSFFH